jgi:hypothetical protein
MLFMFLLQYHKGPSHGNSPSEYLSGETRIIGGVPLVEKNLVFPTNRAG